MNGLENSAFQLWLTPNYWATFRHTSETCGFGIAAQVSPEHSQGGWRTRALHGEHGHQSLLPGHPGGASQGRRHYPGFPDLLSFLNSCTEV